MAFECVVFVLKGMNEVIPKQSTTSVFDKHNFRFIIYMSGDNKWMFYCKPKRNPSTLKYVVREEVTLWKHRKSCAKSHFPARFA